ncbi:MAG: histidine phosphatase family protein, partial [Kangiellaceae bacterium]|nr:histidine phosphatase family protein [Kangiellaceae bacterium]
TLWIMRHGLAEGEFDSDFNRALSGTGYAQALDIAQQVLESGLEIPADMLVSPFRRTQETAGVVHKKLGLEKSFETEEMLVHFAEHKLLGDFLLASDYKNLMLVSHMPIVAKLCQYLVDGCEIYGFQTAQLVRIEIDENGKGSVLDIFLPR